MPGQVWQASVATARGATGIKTAIGTLQMPPGHTKIKALWCQVLGGAVLTTAESVSGILILEGQGMVTQSLPTDQENMLTGGDAHLPTHIIPVDIPVAANSAVAGSITLDDTVTGALLLRWGMCTE
jgi:hypothetical protein